MKRIEKLLFFVAIAVLLLCLGGCGDEKTLEERGYTVTVLYDYNGGTADGLPQLKMLYQPDQPLLAPGSSAEFKEPTLDRFHSIRGWYLAKTDGEGNILKDENGNTLTEDTPFVFKGARAGDNITLVAKWKEKPTVEVHIPGMDPVTEPFNPGTKVTENLLAGILPERRGMTFFGYYSDEDCTHRVTLPFVIKEGADQKLYTKWLEGDVLIVRSRSDLSRLSQYAFKTVYFDADIDMTGARLPAISSFGGKIVGNGHKLSNLTLSASLTGRTTEWGLFGRLTDGAEISDLTFENVHVTVNAAYSGQSLFRVAFLASSVSGTVSLNGLSFQDCTLTLLLPANAAHDIDPGTVYSGVIGVLSDGAQLDYEASGSVTIELPGQS